jgi:hypothetical protein
MGMSPMMQFIISTLTLASVYFYTMMFLESMDPDSGVKMNMLDLVHFITVICVRVFVVATKYGYFSNEHIKIIRQTRISPYLLQFDLIAASVVDKTTDNLYDRLHLIMEFLQIKKSQFYLMINEEDMEGFDRLRSREAMKKYYEENPGAVAKPPEERCKVTPERFAKMKYKNYDEMKFKKSFGRDYPESTDFELTEIEEFFHKKPQVKIDAMTFAVEIVKQNM